MFKEFDEHFSRMYWAVASPSKEELKAKISSLISPLRAFEFSSDRPISFGPLPSIGERYPPNTK